MRNNIFKTLVLCAVASVMSQASYGQTDNRVKTVAGFPAGEAGYGLGVSACYAGMIGDRLVVAGGCNFPEAGKKKYYAGIYAAKAGADSLDWQLIGHLPEPAAYGGVVSMGDSLIFIGGNNGEHSLSSVLSVRLAGGKAVTRQLQSLPYTVDNMAVANDGDDVYVFGGNQDGFASASLLCWNVSDGRGWRYLSRIPDAQRVQPVCVADNGRLYVWGGFFADGQHSHVATCGYSYDVASGTWTQLPAPTDADGTPLTLTGGVALLDGHRAVCLGGVNKDIFWDAISGNYKFVSREDYLKKDIPWYRFNGNMLCYDIAKGEWEKTSFHDSRLARAGAQMVKWGDTYYYIGGELKPSVRTPEILLVR